VEEQDRETTQRLVDEISPWHHSIRVADGVVTPGGKTLQHHHQELLRLQLPNLAGKSVLDIGAWDGYYTFMAEGAAASRVVALDHYVWSVDFKKATEYTSRQLESGQPIRAFHTVPELWDPVGLPGKRGFDLAHRLLHSRAEVVVGDFMTMDLSALGTFDVVLFMGVIYHLEEPLAAMRRVRQLTRGFAAIETEAVLLPGSGGRPLWQFVDAAQLNDDPTIWWVPTAEGLRSMCFAAGFSRVEIISDPSELPRTDGVKPVNYRAVVHAFA
jgi:tRNA (mo5U34)-methyltransferase